MNSNKNIFIAIIIIAVLVLIGLGFWLWQSNVQAPAAPAKTSEPTSPTTGLSQDNTAIISQEIQNIDLGDINADFKEIDKDLQGL